MRFEIRKAQNEENEKEIWGLKLREVKMNYFLKMCFASQKNLFLYCYFLAGFFGLHFKDDLQNLRGAPITF
jgi:hypothetical protein